MWLREHPGVEVVVRDRAGAYAEGASRGAPGAIQHPRAGTRDRFHLVRHVTDACDELLKQRRWQTTPDGNVAPAEPATETEAAKEGPVEEALLGEGSSSGPSAASPEPIPPARPLSPTKQRGIARRAAREARWREVHERRAQGDSIRLFADTLHLHRRTVRRLLESEAPPPKSRGHPRCGGIRSPKLTPFTQYLQQRWRDGCTNAVQPDRGSAERGYEGSRTLLSEAVRSWRPPRAPKPVRQPAQPAGARSPPVAPVADPAAGTAHG